MSLTQFTTKKKNQDSKVQPLVDMLANASNDSLLSRILEHNSRRKASFHMPGHKGRMQFLNDQTTELLTAFDIDTTELEGLDDLTYPVESIREIEKRLAEAYKVSDSFISLGGASHGLIAAILAVSKPGNSVLVPQNAHRSIINGLILSGANIHWYEPEWEAQWGFWGPASAASIESRLEKVSDCAAVVVVSPTFAGAISDMKSISSVCRANKVALLVDEAHGAHFLPGTDMPQSSNQLGADLVVHSLHKTLPGLTQTGVIHVPRKSSVSSDTVKAALRLVTSSSPSYPLMVSIDQVSRLIQKDIFLDRINSIKRLACDMTIELQKIEGFKLYSCDRNVDPLHIALRIDGVKGFDLCKYFQSKGVYSESDLGIGCLFLAGLGNTFDDFECVLKTARENTFPTGGKVENFKKPEATRQKINPKEAFFAASELIDLNSLAGKIAAECYAPCPPGIPVVSPGAQVPENVKQFRSMIGKVRVVKE